MLDALNSQTGSAQGVYENYLGNVPVYGVYRLLPGLSRVCWPASKPPPKRWQPANTQTRGIFFALGLSALDCHCQRVCSDPPHYAAD